MTETETSSLAEGGSRKPQGMFDGFAEYRTPSVEDYQRLFGFGLVVVDTNVLLTLYRSNQRTREDLLTVLDRLRERLWVPPRQLDRPRLSRWELRHSLVFALRPWSFCGR
ncbi:PIN-like domain-containing protein [Streptomyces fungicidicus]|jgi:hypothetical protein|uniref:PIN-like domain-containing protein n=1 Tax=Streptomyces fungicidicus TaxID=68203 RepID=UPI0034034F84